MYRPIIIHLIKNDTGITSANRRCALSDDIIKIHKLGENSIRIIYTERTEDGTLTDVQTMNYMQMLSYLARLFALIAIDVEPFEQIQFTIPAMPRILINVADIGRHTAQMMDLITATCWSWPAISRRPADEAVN